MELREKALSKKSEKKCDGNSTGDDSTDDSVKLGGSDLGALGQIDPNHWVVHGKKFDLRAFVEKHPGGTHAISYGRGRDCTWLVESYHPYSDKVWQVLRKYEVKESEEELVEAWPPKDPFFEDLKKVVREQFPRGAQDAKGTWRVKTLMVVGSIIKYSLLWRMYSQGCFISALFAGAMFTIVNTRIIHEGSHHSLTSSPLLNRVLSNLYSYPVISVETWELQHVISHHQYTNYMAEESGKFQLTDIDATQYDMLCHWSRSLDVSTQVWTLLVAAMVPFAFVQALFNIGPYYSYLLLCNQAINNGEVCKVNGINKVNIGALLCLVCYAASISYLSYNYGVMGIALQVVYMLGSGALFVTFS
jgi:hypothetical protein